MLHLLKICSNEIIPNTNFCAKCGNKISHNKSSENQMTVNFNPKNSGSVKSPQGSNSNVKRDSDNNDLNQLKYLEKLADLRDKGIISYEEFEDKKKEILNL